MWKSLICVCPYGVVKQNHRARRVSHSFVVLISVVCVASLS
jgi:hypothetical protein